MFELRANLLKSPSVLQSRTREQLLAPTFVVYQVQEMAMGEGVDGRWSQKRAPLMTRWASQVLISHFQQNLRVDVVHAFHVILKGNYIDFFYRLKVFIGKARQFSPKSPKVGQKSGQRVKN